MKKILAFISFLIVLTTLISCSENTENESNKSSVDAQDEKENKEASENELQNVGKESLKREPVVYVIYGDTASSTGEISLNTGHEKIEIKSSREKEFSFSGISYLDRPENTEDRISVEIQNKSYEFDYYKTRNNFEASNLSKFKNRQTVNVYKNDTNEIALLATSNEIVFFSTRAGADKEGNFTKEEALEAAKAVIAKLYGNDALEGYTQIEYGDPNEEEPKERLTIGFRRKIFGYDTNDTFRVWFDMEGNFMGLNAYSRGVMKGAEQDLTEEEIENAIEYIEQSFSEVWNIGTPDIIIDAEGDYYIRVGISRKNQDDSIEAMQIYVNIR